MIHLGVVSIMPELIFSQLQTGILHKALQRHLVSIDCWDPRDWAPLPHCQVDDAPYGGGPGMVLKYAPMHAAIQFAKSCMPAARRVIYLSPQGKQVRQADLSHIVQQEQSLLFIAGRYEGIDERLIDEHVDEEWSLGDFVLTGGELAALVYIDAITRLIPGVLGDYASCQQESFMTGQLDHPHYTRPACINGRAVPPVLLSGDHAAIQAWRAAQALQHTRSKRPDLLKEPST